MNMTTTKRLLDKYEEATHDKLEQVCHANFAKAFPKVRVADVLRIDKSGLTDPEFRYALMAHFDFTITDENKDPLFAVEYDGASHKDPKQIERDKLKDSICEKLGFSLLRINSNFINRKFRDYDLLTYLVEIWFLSKAFDEAQEQGSIPWDEGFEPSLVVSTSETSKSFPYWLSLDAQLVFQKLKETGKINQGIASYWTGRDRKDNIHCIAWIQVQENGFLVVITGMRAQNFPIMQSEIISQIAVIDLLEKTKDYLSGKSNLIPSEKINGVIKEFTSRYKLSSFVGFANPEINLGIQ